MREEGYAAVTSRRVAERAGLKSQLVHYHFGTMDELFQAAYRRNDKRYFENALKIVSSENPLHEIWADARSIAGGEVVAEYVAAANHRKVLQDELVQSWSRYRSLFTTIISKQLEGRDVSLGVVTPQVLNFIISAISKSIIEEASLGFTEDHKEIVDFMDKLVVRLTDAPSVSKLSRTRKSTPKLEVGRAELDNPSAASPGPPPEEQDRPAASRPRVPGPGRNENK